ncbi:MAG: hypothetical protein FWG58_00215 [Methanomassiliicoccaceae archaeon]|nr:hypothetical protein [Methanomassiliicoccaceae archaeon]MCL1983806.1 hypothetical protein [Methanomassiliicoccaceae archaeon]
MGNIGQELLNVPFGDMVVQVASAIAEGQYKMDLISCKIAKMMGDKDEAEIEMPDLTGDGGDVIKTTLIGAGFQPTFYQFSDTIIEVKMAITMTTSTTKSVSASAKGGFGCFSASVNASYSNKYSYEASGSSLLRTRITPVPPSPFMTKMLEMKAQLIQLQFDQKIKEAEAEIKKQEAAAAAEKKD